MAGQLGDLTTIAAAQAGVFSFQQAERAGIDRRKLRRAEADGLLTRPHPQVYRFRGSPATDLSQIWASVLQVGSSRATHEAALRLHGVERIPADVVVSVPPDRAHRHAGIRVHRANDLIDEQCALIDGLPTTTIERAVVDVAAVFLPGRLAHLVDDLTMIRRITSVGSIGRTLRQVNSRGRLNIGRLGPILDARRPLEPAPRSRLERRVDDLLAPSCLPRPLAEHPLPSMTDYRGYVDRAWIETKLILEIDGRSWHSRQEAMARDRARDRQASRLGWLTLRVLDEEIATCPRAVVGDIEGTYAERAAQFRLAG